MRHHDKLYTRLVALEIAMRLLRARLAGAA
jgi:hypothetical protein